MRFMTDTDGTRWRVDRCDYRHRGKTKRRFILRRRARSGSPESELLVKFASSIGAAARRRP